MAGSLSEKFSEIDKQNGWMLLFTVLRQQSAQNSYEEAKQPANARLNRYRDVLPFDHSRVRLGDDGYINASFVPIPEADRSYILTQGPLSNTSGDFWQMVWEQNSRAVIMLNRIMEKGQNKCHLYYPTTDDNNGFCSKSQKYGNFDVELLNERKTKHYIVRSVKLTNTEIGENREVTHFQFVTWPDFGVPESTSDFLEFLLEVRRSGLLNKREYGPPVIHCSAGVGRSGTFVIADAALVIAHKTKDPSQVDIVQMVLDLRKHRMGLIQTHEQLRFSWKAVVDALEQKRWKELVEMSSSDGHEHDSQSGPLVSDEEEKGNRPTLKRLSGNQLTDDSSDTEIEDVDDEETAADMPSTVTASAASNSKELEKSPKRPRPDISRFSQPVSHTPTDAAIEDDKKEKEEMADKKQDTSSPESESQNTTTDTTLAGGDAAAAVPATDTATERYEARHRRRQERAKEVQKKIDKIHENLRRSSSANVWSRYNNWIYGGAAVLVGGLLVYLFCRWGL